MGEEMYRCAACGHEFEKEWSDEEAMAESKLLWGDLPEKDLCVICDDCFERGKDAALANYNSGMLKN